MMETKEESAADGVAVQRWKLVNECDGWDVIPADTGELIYYTDHAAIVRERDKTIAALREQVAVLSRDAERYRVAREQMRWYIRRDRVATLDEVDQYIDAAIAGEEK